MVKKISIKNISILLFLSSSIFLIMNSYKAILNYPKNLNFLAFLEIAKLIPTRLRPNLHL